MIKNRDKKVHEKSTKTLNVYHGLVGEIFNSADEWYYFWKTTANDVLNDHALTKKMQV